VAKRTDGRSGRPCSTVIVGVLYEPCHHKLINRRSESRGDMHAVLTWDNNAPDDKRQQVEALILAALQPYSWVRPLKSAVVVVLPNEPARIALGNDLIMKSRSVNDQFIFFISPLVLGAQYYGYLPADSWPKLAELSSK